MTNISNSDVILLAHAAFGVTGCLAALWVFVETLNARPANSGRIRTGALVTAFLMTAGWICGGFVITPWASTPSSRIVAPLEYTGFVVAVIMEAARRAVLYKYFFRRVT